MKSSPFLWAIWMAGSAGVMFALYNLSELTWHALGYVNLPASKAIIAAGPYSSSHETPDIAPILAWAPFGRRIELASIGASQTSLNIKSLKLLAVRVSEGAFQSTATISVEGRPAEIFRPGDTVSQGIRLDQVMQRGVVLDVNGKSADLGFEMIGGAERANILQVDADASGQRLQSTISPAPAPEEIIDAYRQQIASDPAGLVRRFSLQPSPQGYVVGENPPVVLLAAGLQPGDRVTRVNGAPVGNVSSDSRLFETVIASGRARVEIDRNGRAIILTFPLQ